MLFPFAQSTSDAPAHSRRPRLNGTLLPITLSLAVHGAFFFMLHQRSQSPDLVPQHAPALTVYFRPAPPDALPAPTRLSRQSELPKSPKKTVLPDTVITDPRHAPQTIIPPDSRQPSPDQEHKKRIDVEGVYQQLGKIVGDIDRENHDSPVGQLRAASRSGLHEEQGLSRDVTRAGRHDCMAPASLPGGLLAPIYLLMDRKGTGCKF